MLDNSNHYTLRTEISEGIMRYYVSFVDGQAMPRETEVSRPVYLEFLSFVKHERNLQRWGERHTERYDLTDEMLYKRALYPQKSVEETTVDSLRNEQLLAAIQQLTETQRRRFILYHEFGLTYEQIADIDGCKKQSVYETILLAERKIKEKTKNFWKQP